MKTVLAGPRLRAEESNAWYPRELTEKQRAWQQRHNAVHDRLRNDHHSRSLNHEQGTPWRSKKPVGQQVAQGDGHASGKKDGSQKAGDGRTQFTRTASQTASGTQSSSVEDVQRMSKLELVKNTQQSIHSRLIKAGKKATAMQEMAKSIDSKVCDTLPA